MEKKKFKRFRLFNLQKEGKGISKNAATLSPGFKRFFVTYKNSFSKLVSINIFFILGNFPILFLIAGLSTVSKNDIYYPLSDLFQNLNGLFAADGGYTPYKLSLYALEGLQTQGTAPTLITYILYAIGALTIFTFGPVNAATAYILRNIVSGEPIFIWHDFWYALKRNVKQAIPFGIFDVILNALLIFNVYTMFVSGEKFLTSMLFWCYVLLFALYFMMRFYVYVQMVTFKLSLFKIFKNSFIFALVGFKRNILAVVGILFCLFLEIFLLFFTNGILVPLAVAAPLTILMSTMAFIKVYASYFKIKDIMIDPYLREHPEEAPAVDEDIETIMRDDVTERERLAEIKKRNNIDY